MSSSVGYGYSYVDLEAQRQRALRAEIAQLRQRLAMLREQSTAVAAKRTRRRTLVRRAAATGTAAERTASSAELGSVVTKLTAEVAQERARLDTALNGMWADRLATVTTSRTTTPTGVHAVAGATAPETATETAPAAVRADALATADTLVRNNAGRCDTADLSRLDDLLGELAAASTADDCHDLLFEVRSVVKDSIDRRRRAEETELVRSRLLALAEDATEDERDHLRTAVEIAHDPEALRERVMYSVGRADRARARAVVAEATADALREIGCEVGEDFTTRLANGGQGVAAFTHDVGDGYGLLVRLPDDRAQLQAAVVRRVGVDPDPDRERLVQQDFCDVGLRQAVHRLGDSGIELHETLRLEPGRRAPQPVDPDDWPPRTVEPATTERDTAPPGAATAERPTRRTRPDRTPAKKRTTELAKERRRATD